MTRTPSTMLGLGTEAPGFRLPDAAAGGKEVALSDFEAAPALLVVFLCNHCPFVQHVAGELAALSRDLPAQGAAMVGISSNDASAYPADGPDAMAAEAARQGWAFPYLYDETQAVARRLPGRLHPRLLPLRRRPQARLPGPARRQPPRQRPPRDRRRPPGRRRRRPRRPPRPRGPAPQPRLQHQVEAGQRARVRLTCCGGLASPTGRARPPRRSAGRADGRRGSRRTVGWRS